MDDVLRNVVTQVCGQDAQLGAQWYELLGGSRPSAEDGQWTELVERIGEAGGTAVGASTDELMSALTECDPAELRAEIASVVWPETVASQQEPAAEGAAAGATEEDPGAWHTYLVTNAGRWDGDVRSWPAFVDWFVYYAQEQGVGGFARTFCDYASANGPREVLAQYGVQVPAAATAGTAASAVSETAAEVVAAVGEQLFVELRKQNSDLDDVSDEELKIALGELLTEQPGLAASGTE